MTVICCPRCNQDIPEPDLSCFVRFYHGDTGLSPPCPGCGVRVWWKMSVKIDGDQRPRSRRIDAKVPRWERLVEVEPRLRALEDRARSQRGRSGSRKLDYWYRSIKPDLGWMVGWMGEGELKGSEAYDLAYDYLLHHALGWGDCRDCAACRAEAAA